MTNPNPAPVFSPLTGHWSDCATYETLDGSDCTCWDRLATPIPAWAYAAENLEAARAAGYDV